MNTRPFVTAVLILLGISPVAYAATTIAQTGTASPTQAASPLTVPESTTAPAELSMPNGRPTLGDWEDLAEREAFKAQLAKLNSESGKSGQTALPPLPGQLQAPGAQGTDYSPKKPHRANDSCNDIDTACFYAVYGMHIDGGDNNYHGLLAIDGLVEAVYKGKHFVTPHGRYTVRDISTHELAYADARGRVHTVPFAGEADVQADPTELKIEQTQFAQPPTALSFPRR